MRWKNTLAAFIGGLAALSVSQAFGALLTVYSNDFDSPAILSGGTTGGIGGSGTVVGVQGFAGLGPGGNQFGGNLLQNSTTPPTATTLSLANLPAHNSVDVNFLLAIIDSWDSTNGSPAPDLFQVFIDGVMVVNNTFANASGTVTQPVGTDIGSGLVQRGFSPNYLDRAYDAGTDAALTVAHVLPTLTVSFIAAGNGWQGGADESWGIDNLNVVVNTITANRIPEPGTLALFGLGLAGLGFARRRRAA